MAHAAFECPLCVYRSGSDLDESRHLTIGDGDSMFCCVTFHLGQQVIAGRQELVEIFSLFTLKNCV
jgi:hypothetical protein